MDNKRRNDGLVILSNRVDDLFTHGIDEVERENTDGVVIGTFKDKVNINLTLHSFKQNQSTLDNSKICELQEIKGSILSEETSEEIEYNDNRKSHC